MLFAVSELNEKGLIENGEKIADKFKGLSRREIVRKVGVASLVALPIVSSILAPQAAAAESRPRIQITLTPDPTDPTPTPTPYCVPAGQSAGTALFLGGNHEAICNSISNRCCFGEIRNAQPAPHTAAFADAARCCTLTATTADCPQGGRTCSCKRFRRIEIVNADCPQGGRTCSCICD